MAATPEMKHMMTEEAQRLACNLDKTFSGICFIYHEGFHAMAMNVDPRNREELVGLLSAATLCLRDMAARFGIEPHGEISGAEMRVMDLDPKNKPS